LNSRH